MRTIKDHLLPGHRGEEGMSRQSIEDFEGSETTLVVLQWWIQVIINLSRHRMHNIKSDP